MKAWNFDEINRGFTQINRWVNQISLQKLEDAYKSGAVIKEIEDLYYDGGIITFDPNKGKIASDYFRTQLDRELAKVRFNLAQFRLGSFLFNHKSLKQNTSTDPEAALAQSSNQSQMEAVEALILEKIAFIESVVSKYRDRPSDLDVTQTAPVAEVTNPSVPDPLNKANGPEVVVVQSMMQTLPTESKLNRPRQDKPSSLWRRVTQFGKELTPEYEQEVIWNLRVRRQQDRTAVRWLILLLIVPILVQISTKNLIFDPLLNGYGERHYAGLEFNEEVVEEYLTEFSRNKEVIEIKELLGVVPEMTQAEKAQKIKELAKELLQESIARTMNGIENLLSDGVGLAVFIALVHFSRKKLAVLRSFSNRTFLSLSDSVKVFFFILVTDMFVGFHSAEGWETILESFAQHFGLPENKAAINMFIATVPVIMDSCIKFWIFNYLTRYSPAASSIYERMNT